MIQFDNKTRFFSTVDQREFGKKSKILGLLSPGAYNAKEAAKYGYDPKEYKKNRWKYALLGHFSPATATYIKHKVIKMHRDGKSQKEIRDYLKHPKLNRIAAGTAEGLLGGISGAASVTIPIAYASGASSNINNTRAYRFKSKGHNQIEDYRNKK